MASLYLSAVRDGGKTLTLKPITNRLAAAFDPPLEEMNGYFLVEEDGFAMSVIARVETEDAALKLGNMLGLA
jgi:hypothetical protein